MKNRKMGFTVLHVVMPSCAFCTSWRAVTALSLGNRTQWYADSKKGGCGKTKSDISCCKAAKRWDHPAHNELSSDIFCANRSTGSWGLKADILTSGSEGNVLHKKGWGVRGQFKEQSFFYTTETNSFVSRKTVNCFVGMIKLSLFNIPSFGQVLKKIGISKSI